MKYSVLLLAAALGAAPLAAGAQSAPPAPEPSTVTAPSATPMNSPLPAPSPGAGGPTGGSMSGTPVTPKPETSPSSSGGTSSGAGEVHRGVGSGTSSGNKGRHLGQIKHLPNGSLSVSDLRYALTHPLQEANKVRSMKSVSFDKLRVYRLSSSLKTLLKVGALDRDTAILAELSPAYEVAQTNGSNSPIAYLQYVLANINVSNALNNVSVLNNSNVNVGVTLQDVLNDNKISIGQVAGIFVNGLGIITTITK
jgi:hypothetical protein